MGFYNIFRVQTDFNRITISLEDVLITWITLDYWLLFIVTFYMCFLVIVVYWTLFSYSITTIADVTSRHLQQHFVRNNCS